MTYETIILERIGAVARIALDRPEKRNAVNDTVHAELRDALTVVETDAGIKAMILTGTECGFSYDYGEGVNAFLEKRQPRFTGR